MLISTGIMEIITKIWPQMMTILGLVSDQITNVEITNDALIWQSEVYKMSYFRFSPPIDLFELDISDPSQLLALVTQTRKYHEKVVLLTILLFGNTSNSGIHD